MFVSELTTLRGREMNTDRLLGYAKDQYGDVKDLTRLGRDFGCVFDGTGYYIELSQSAVDYYAATGDVLSPWEEAFFFGGPGESGVVPNAVQSGEKQYLLLTLLPPQIQDPYAFVSRHRGFVEALAILVDRMQSLSQGLLDVVLRYAPEMNDLAATEGINGVSAAEFVRSFRMIRELFARRAPNVLFSFSPAIRSDLDATCLADFWPGVDCVDVVSCSWHVGSAADFGKSVNQVLCYFRNRQGHLRYGIDELGVMESGRQDADELLVRMPRSLSDLADVGIRFDYVSLFVDWDLSPDTLRLLGRRQIPGGRSLGAKFSTSPLTDGRYDFREVEESTPTGSFLAEDPPDLENR